MKAGSLLDNMNEQTVQNPKYFVFEKKRYLIDFDLLKQKCTYFYQNQDKFINEDDINIFEEDEEFPLTEESIRLFIMLCQNEVTVISLDSVIPLQYLSYKYEYLELKKITDEFIIKYPKDLIFKKLLLEKKKSDNYTQYENDFYDTTREEEYISKHLNDFITMDEITQLKIPVLLRILDKYFKCEESDMKVNNKDMIDFFFRCIDKCGIEASILLNNIDFGRLQQYKFDSLQQTSESDIQKKELFVEMYKKIEEQSEELKRLKEEGQMKEIEYEKKEKERKEKYDNEIDKIKKDVDQRLLDIEKKYEQIMIDNSNVQKFHKIIIELLSDDGFYRLDTESQIFVVDEIVNKSKYQDKYEKADKLESMALKILFYNQLFQNSSKNESNKNLEELVQFILENAKILRINNDICI